MAHGCKPTIHYFLFSLNWDIRNLKPGIRIFKETMYAMRLNLFNASKGVGRAERGFTLLEVMVSLSIIAIALMAVYGNYSQTIAMNTDQQFNTLAPLLAARVAADFENRSPADLADESGNFGPEFEGYEWVVVVEPIPSEILGNIAEDLHSIDITVSFNNAERVFHCTTVRFIRRESES